MHYCLSETDKCGRKVDSNNSLRDQNTPHSCVPKVHGKVRAVDPRRARTISCDATCKQKPRDIQRCLSGGFAAAGRMTAELEEVTGSSCATM